MTKPKSKQPGRKKAIKLTTDSERAECPSRKAPYWVKVKKGQALGYQRGPYGAVWVARLNRQGRKIIGVPPEEPSQSEYPVLTFAEAMAAAETWCEGRLHPKQEPVPTNMDLDPWRPGSDSKPERPTVGQALDMHLYAVETRQIEAKGSSRSKIRRIKAALGHHLLSELTSNHLTTWQANIVANPPQRRNKKGADPAFDEDFDPEDHKAKRRRQSTANRYLGDLKASLNRAFEAGWIDTDRAWRGVKRFADATGVRDQILDPQEQGALLNGCTPELRPLTFGALLTASRPGPMRKWLVKNFRPEAKCILVGWDKAHDRERLAPLTKEAIAVFHWICKDRDPEEPMFIKANGHAWGRNHYSRAFKEALREMDLDLTFYSLRHTCITMWLLAGIDTATVASAVGTSAQMIEQHYRNPRVGSLADLIDSKAQRIGSFDDEVEEINAYYEEKRLNRLQTRRILTFSLSELHPSSYAGKIEGGLTEPPPAKRRPTPEELKGLVSRMPACQVGDLFGVSGTTIKNWSLQAGFLPAKRGDWAKRRKEEREGGETTAEAVSPPVGPTREELEQLIPLMPATKIGKQYGLSANAILERAKKFGIVCPGVGHWAKQAGEEHQRGKKARKEAARLKGVAAANAKLKKSS